MIKFRVFIVSDCFFFFVIWIYMPHLGTYHLFSLCICIYVPLLFIVPDMPIFKASFLGSSGNVIASGRRSFFYLYDSEASKVRDYRCCIITHMYDVKHCISSVVAYPLIFIHTFFPEFNKYRLKKSPTSWDVLKKV